MAMEGERPIIYPGRETACLRVFAFNVNDLNSLGKKNN